ncbi:adenosylmethionine decarboxylase [Fervidicoccus fontis]|uniref:S-adenosylmethionine decarboxylase proenzyme n=5 Tax=Fervidicoccus fontis TaxID=683846 RepID=I0A018_FERFK|nr:adenosylmethionine decarboxylase [Fervidicoccus fontis]AFH42325.1 S-adenosylmethionine decarboxylase proenzyme [Fervidicoccus fontis Kam940]MBE9391775.1 adenosylmethionine decarboxylase [Fervidicoccus fontis]
MESGLLIKENIRENVSVKVYGSHIYGNLKNCNRAKLSDEGELKNIVANAAKIGKMTMLDLRSWKIGEGVSVVAVILESHITVHTWPEYNFATVDVYSCGTHTNPKAAFEYIARELEAEEVEYGEADRSLA